MPSVTDAFAETSVDQLKVLVSNLLPQQREGGRPLSGVWGLLYNPAGFVLSLWCSRWVFHTSERWER